nr:hypothetical protein [Tanacetum cinerariifolium]
MRFVRFPLVAYYPRQHPRGCNVAHVACHVADPAQTQSRPGPDPTQVQALTAYQPPLTGGPVVVNDGRAAVNGGSPPATVVDRHRRPSITTVIRRRGGWTNGRMTRHRRYCSSMRGQYKVQKSQYEVQALTAYQPPLTGGPVVVNGGSPPATVVDRHRRPSITTVIRRHVGWTNGRMTRHR